MRDKIAYVLVKFVLNWIASKEYQSFINLMSGIGVYIFENDLAKIDRDKFSEQAEFGEYVYHNWDKFEGSI